MANESTIKGYSDIGTMLYAIELGADGKIPTKGFKEFVEVKSTSDKGAEPEQIAVTSLKDTRNVYVEGRTDTPTQTYVINNTPENTAEVVKVAGKPYAFLEIYSDGSSVLFTGTLAHWINAISVNSARDRTLAITVMTMEEKDKTATDALIAVA